MKKFSLYFFVTLIFCNTSFSQSSLPECEGNDNNISEFSMKHFEIVRKWTNCHGIAIGPKGAKYIGEFYKGKFHGLGTFMKDGRKYVGEYRNHKRHGEGTYTYANGDGTPCTGIMPFMKVWIGGVNDMDWIKLK